MKSLDTTQVKKHVATIHTSGELSLLERKVSNILLLNAYDKLLTQRTHTIPIKHLWGMLGWDASNNAEDLQSVLVRLASVAIEFNLMEDGKHSWHVMSLLSYGNIEKGLCTYRYDEYLAQRLYDPEIYATINIGIQRRFEGNYAFTLYENCLRYKLVGSTGWWTIEKFKKIMGANAAMYDEFKYLKRDVIMKPIDDINRVSDIQVMPEFQRSGRKVSAVRFVVTDNPQQALLKPDIQDDHTAIRESELFKRLLEHGIGERLAILWVLQDETRVRGVIEYVEDKAKKKQVKGSTAGYIRTLYENNAVVGKKTPFEEKKLQEQQAKKDDAERKAQEKKAVELKADFIRERADKLINTLSADERHLWINTYIEKMGDEKAKAYNTKTGDFRTANERIEFRIWLRKYIAPDASKEEYNIWLKLKGHALQSVKIDTVPTQENKKPLLTVV
ncbi:replication initiation protein [Crenothrix polyspora]|uniref:Initiator Replication protein n=1 Tax=Crenothrix polyspora TaxID=360316 RepID=A0A1R4HJ95_9GAMM|nr:replication initiation protein [Crenothrix polyspora]SJM95950.1 Initiator Replication protein [Crenothrix polyspora]